MKELGRNDPCSCGSGKKYKKCCGEKKSLKQRAFQVVRPEGNSLLGRIAASGQAFREQQEKQSTIQPSAIEASLMPQSENITPPQEKD